MTAATLADGQLAASSASILAANNAAGLSEDRVVNAIFCNTSVSNTEVVILTLTRAGGTARRVTRASLAPNESLYVRGLAMGPADVLAGYATDASTVDYTIVRGDGAPFEAFCVDASGSRKTSTSGTTGNLTLTGSLTASTGLSLTPGASTAAAGTTTADAGVLPAATSSVYPTTAADDTKGVRIHADDKVTGRVLFIGNGVSNKILKVYAPSGGAINGASADAAFSSASGGGAVIVCLSSAANTWLAW